jgi:RNA polymerase sigma-70 factor (ECF subfamily)
MPTHAEDATLTALAAKADPIAQQTLGRRLMGRVQRLSRVLLRNSADASDASQASMIQILRSAGTYRAEGSLESWADRIVLRTVMRSYSAERRARLAKTMDEGASSVRAAGDPSVLVRQYLDRLSEPQCTVLLLRHGFGYSIEEIAEITEVSPNTVKDRLLRARATIRRLMRRERLASDVWLSEGGR